MDKQPTSRTCFLCGKDNPVGLKMEWYNQDDSVVGHVTVPDHFNGYPGVVHGGIVAAILDETAGRAILLNDPMNLMVTIKLEVAYKHPTPTDTNLTVIGRARRETRRRALVEGEIVLPDGTVTATCNAIIVQPPNTFKESWEEEKKYWKVR